MHIVRAVCVVSMLAMSSVMGAQPAAFEFDSGSSHHPEGFGAWRVRWDASGFAITHQVRDRVIEYPPVRLAPEDDAALRALIDAAGLDRRGDAVPPAAPGRPVATFRTGNGDRGRSVRVWVDWDRDGDPIVRLTHKIGELIEKHTGVTPVLRS
jgi:hypothetical protein